MTDTVCIYHRNCFDGIASAWVVEKRYPGARLIACGYQEPPPPMKELANKRVFVVDFSYPRDVLEEINRRAKSLAVFDHHDTARQNCDGLAFAIFDNERCGASITWDFLNPGKKRPRLIEYAEDYDLWRFDLPFSHEVNATLQSYAYSTAEIGLLVNELEIYSGPSVIWKERLVSEGTGILRARQRVVETIARNAIELEIRGNNVLGVECAREFRNEVAGELSIGRLFGVAFETKKDGMRHYSLRVRDSDFRVCDLAAHFGGGGHERAAGFHLKLEHGADPFQVRDSHMLEALNKGHVPGHKG